MIRTIRRLALALSAASVLAALGAASALAVEFHSGTNPTVLTGQQPENFNDAWGFDAGSATCELAQYTGGMSGSTTKEATFAPTFSGCTATFAFLTINVDPNGCEFRFTTGGAKEVIHITCPAGKVIEWTAPGCTITTPPQTIENGITWTSETAGSRKALIAMLSVTGMLYEEHNKGFFPTCKNNTIAKSNGTWVGSLTFTGESTGGTATDIWRE